MEGCGSEGGPTRRRENPCPTRRRDLLVEGRREKWVGEMEGPTRRRACPCPASPGTTSSAAFGGRHLERCRHLFVELYVY